MDARQDRTSGSIRLSSTKALRCCRKMEVAVQDMKGAIRVYAEETHI